MATHKMGAILALLAACAAAQTVLFTQPITMDGDNPVDVVVREGDHLPAVAARFCATHRYGRIDARCAELVAAGLLDRYNVLRRGLLFDALHRDRVVRGGGAVSVVQIGAFDGVMDDPVFECVTSRERWTAVVVGVTGSPRDIFVRRADGLTALQNCGTTRGTCHSTS